MTSMREERLQERVAEIRPQLAKAREIVEIAEAEARGMTPDEQKDYDAIMARAGDVADGMKRVRDEDALMTSIRNEFGDVMGGSLRSSKSSRLSFKGIGSQVAAKMLPDGMKSLAPSGAAVASTAVTATASSSTNSTSWPCSTTTAGPARRSDLAQASTSVPASGDRPAISVTDSGDPRSVARSYSQRHCS